ncbi:phage tail tape measure protein [Robertmurraya sp. DFI.2.37]|uniref:phage tail tape measure protein n=1 Tax=Robertmurraya sp. DFI.2.37 TaxID=3031819 RepID=UPI0012452502|nr:phage tail tape measure protein [Robertmurraya sp. DFI.2.37]MDF1510763.1 phage tail tape measure protein [Robertmurraya sp. DFI.2.37]
MKYVSPVAKAAGQSLESMAAAAGILGNAGIQADQAGTSLRMMLIRLAKPPKMARDALDELGISVSDSAGKMKPLSQIIGEMTEATKGMTEADRLAAVAKISGTEASAAMLALMDAGQGTIEAFTAELENAGGTAEEIAAKQLDNLLGQLTILKSALEGAAIAIGNALLPALKVIVAAIQSAVDWFNGLSDASKTFISIGLALGSVFMLLTGPLLILVSMIPSLVAGFGAIAGALGMTSGALLSSIALWGGIIAAIIAVGSALVIAYNEVEWFRNGIHAAWAGIVSATIAVGAAIKNAFGEAVDWSVRKFDDFKTLATVVGGHVSTAIGVIKTTFNDLQSYVATVAPIIFGKFIDTASEFLTNVKSVFSGDPKALVPVIETLGPTIVGLLIGGLPGMLISLSRFMPAIADALQAGTPQIIEGINAVVDGIVNFFENSFPVIVQVGLDLILNLINGILAALPTVIGVATQIIETLVGVIGTVLPQILTVGVELLTTLLEGIVSAIPLLIAGILTVIDSLTQAIISNLPMIVDSGVQVISSLVEGLSTAIPLLVMAALYLIAEIVSTLISSLPKIIDSGVKILMALIDGILSILPTLIATAIKLILQIVSTLIANLPKIIDSGIKILMALIDGIIRILPQLIATALNLIVQIAGTLIKNLPKILAAGVQILWELIKGIVSVAGSLVLAITTEIIPSIVDTIKSVNLFDIGKNIIQGLINGIGSMASAVWDKVTSIASGIANAITGFFDMHSPSRLTRGFGQDIGKGWELGLSDSINGLVKTAAKMSEAVSASIDMSYDAPNVASRAFAFTHALENENQRPSVVNMTVNQQLPEDVSPAKERREQERIMRRMAEDMGVLTWSG